MTEEDVIKDFFEHGKIEGYTLPELTLFAKACRDNGITNEDLAEYVHDFKKAYAYAMDYIMRKFEEEIVKGEWQ